MPRSELLDEMKTQELEILVEQLLADLGMGEPSFKFDAVSAWADGQYWIDFTDRRQLIGSQFKTQGGGRWSVREALWHTARGELIDPRARRMY